MDLRKEKQKFLHKDDRMWMCCCWNRVCQKYEYDKRKPGSTGEFGGKVNGKENKDKSNTDEI